MGVNTLWRAPRVNSINNKALSIPALNPRDKYGRTFLFSTFGFMVAFMSWYAFPPLLSKTIKSDLNLTQSQIANSNIIALVATLFIRMIIGPLCDHYGPRYCFAGILLAGTIPTAMAGLVTNAKGLIALRFFMGILGGSFVPCQVWGTGFFDKSIVGSANALMAGVGNTGGGITYFLMPAIFDSLVHNAHLSPHQAWRVAFIVPFILITATALGMLAFCEDTPTGPWAERNLHSPRISGEGVLVDTTGEFMGLSVAGTSESVVDGKSYNRNVEDQSSAVMVDNGIGIIAQSEVVVSPSFSVGMKVFLSPQCIMLAFSYFCSFGAELAINSILGAYYIHTFPDLSETHAGRWAAMFGLLNAVFRPLGGIIADALYRLFNKDVRVKKYWIVALGVAQGAVCLAIGMVDLKQKKAMTFTLVGVLAGFIDAGNGANFALVPHVFPEANGILSGIIGAAGNLGGVVFAIIFRYNGTNYSRGICIIGIITIAANVCVSWIKPIPQGQIGGR